MQQTGQGNSDPTLSKRKRGNPGRVLLAALLVLVAAIPVTIGVLGTYHVFSYPDQPIFRNDEWPYRLYFLPFRYLGFVMPLLFATAVLLVGAIAIVRFRRGSITNPQYEIGSWSRWAGRLAALGMFGLASVIAVVIVVEDIWDALPSHQGVPSDQVAWSVVGLIISLAAAYGAARILRSDPFQLGITQCVGLLLGLALVLLVSYGATDFGTSPGTALLQTGFHGYAYDPHPKLSFPIDVACGDRFHCVIESLVSGTGAPAVGFASTADGGRSWSTVAVPSTIVNSPSPLSCTGPTCWGLFASPKFAPAYIGSIAISGAGKSRITFHKIAPPTASEGDNYTAWSTCNSATHCVSFIRRPGLNSGLNTGETIVNATDDAGLHWVSWPLAIGPAEFLSPPQPYARSGPWCSSNGQCFALATAQHSDCQNLPSCSQQIVSFQSSDNGAVWTQSESLPPIAPANGVLDASCEGMPTCTANWTPQHGVTVISISTDFGNSWESPTSLDRAGTLKCTANDLCMKTFLGPSPTPDAIAATIDGGKTWREAPIRLRQAVSLDAAMGCGTQGPCLVAIQPQPNASPLVVTVSGSGVWSITALPIPSDAKIEVVG
jgi:hypothetical protein